MRKGRGASGGYCIIANTLPTGKPPITGKRVATFQQIFPMQFLLPDASSQSISSRWRIWRIGISALPTSG